MICAGIKALWLLAHEFGHVKYQVPHLASYVDFYKSTYLRKSFNSNFIGHFDDDSSGKVAKSYGRRYQQNYKIYRKHIKSLVKEQIALNKKVTQ